jgi:NAD(P)-dependent dehydrogenase (short-subunit alcohol dehydrogenase family)
MNVLITGCSSGIGRAAALRLHEVAPARSLTVYATARRPDTLKDLAARGIRTLALDVTDEASMAAAVAAVDGGVGVLVNNAGYGLYGPVEQLSMDEVRRQFETNVFGLMRLTQLVLPGMRAAGRGRIVNVSSMGGRTTLPGGAAYHATKHAVEALSDALRIEVAPFGIDVVVVEPGPVDTPWNDVAAASAADSRPGDPYAQFRTAVAAAFREVYTGPWRRMTSTADDIAEVIVKAATAPRPRTRYLVNGVAKSSVLLKRLLPDRAHDAFLRAQFGLPKRGQLSQPNPSPSESRS